VTYLWYILILDFLFLFSNGKKRLGKCIHTCSIAFIKWLEYSVIPKKWS
jgi:hypothetical protein